MSNAKKIVIGRLIKTYGTPPPTRVAPEHLAEFMGEYIKIAEGFPDDVLARGMDEVIRDNNYQMWPVPGTVYAAFKKHVPVPALQSPNWNEEAKETPTPEQVANVRRMAKLFRESVKEVPKADAKEALKGTPYENIFKVDRITMAENEKRWSAAERVDGKPDPIGMRKRDYEAVVGRKLP